MQRFKVPAENVDEWASKHFRNAEFISRITYDKPKVTRLFLSGDIVMIIDRIAPRLITVYHACTREENYTDEIFRLVRAQKIVREDIKRLRGMLPSITAQTMRDKIRIESEMLDRRRQFLRTRSEARRLALQARINVLEFELSEIHALDIVRKSDISHYIVKAL